MHRYVYIYIYIYMHPSPGPFVTLAPGCSWFGANYYTPELTNMKLHWKVPQKSHWTVPVKSTGKKTTILLQIPLTSDNSFEHVTDKPLEHVSEHL